MTQDYAIGIGTVGAGLWMGYGGGEKWRHVQQGPPIEGNCRALAVDPARPGMMWAAADRAGLFTSTDGGSRWEHHGPALDTDIWSIGLDPHDDDRIYLGVAPGILRSKDGGDTFDRLDDLDQRHLSDRYVAHDQRGGRSSGPGRRVGLGGGRRPAPLRGPR